MIRSSRHNHPVQWDADLANKAKRFPQWSAVREKAFPVDFTRGAPGPDQKQNCLPDSTADTAGERGRYKDRGKGRLPIPNRPYRAERLAATRPSLLLCNRRLAGAWRNGVKHSARHRFSA